MNKSFALFWALIPFLFLPFSGKNIVPEVATPPTKVIQKGEPGQPTPPATPPPCNCTVTQGNFSFPLPTLAGSTSASNFYAYGNPIGASANTGLEMSETMLIMMYEDVTTGNTSLILILDQANDGTGGNGTITFDCMPSGSFVEFSDDAGELTGAAPTFTGNFNWSSCCTDGGIIGGMSCNTVFTINPNISSGINAFSLVYGSAAFPTYVNMPEINCPITINCGGTSTCCAGAFEFTGFASPSSCGNTADGSVSVSTTCATMPTFQWSNGANTSTVNGLLPGAYSVTITDANGCSQSSTYIVTSGNPDPQPTISGPTEFCAGENVELALDGPYSTIQWSNGFNSSPITVNAPGTYTVTVTNAAGCSGTTSTTLIQHPLPMPNITGPTGVCFFGDTITLNAGAGYATYQWSTGEFSQTIDVTQFGTYMVTVSNSFGCTGMDLTIVEPLSNPFPFIVGPTNICNPNVPITLDAGAGFSSYLWTLGHTTQTVNAYIPGTYTVTVTNADGCTGTAAQDVTNFGADTVTVSLTSCNPQDTGTFVQLLVNQYLCDSLVTTIISLSESDSVFLASETCDPQEVGTFVQNFTNQFGCDSVVVETVTLLPADSTFILDHSCQPQDTGVVVQTLTNQYGCDSIVTITTLFLLSDTTYVFDQTCDPNEAGVTQMLMTNSEGCDSLVITTINFVSTDTTYLTDTTCDPNGVGQSEQLFTNQGGCDSLVITNTSFLLSDTTYLTANTCNQGQAGQSQQLFSNQNGCDSLVITTTTFIPPDTTLLSTTTCDPQQAGVAQVILANSFGCDSLVITTTSLLPSDTTYISQTSCDPNQSGTQEILLSNEFGCDSLVIVTTTYSLADSTFISLTSCDPNAAGVNIQVLMSSDGCDSVVTTTTILLPSDTIYVNAQSCNTADVGMTQSLLSNQYGCDSLVITTTTLLPSDTTYLSASTCDLNQAGQSTLLLVNQYGCDSLIVTNTAYNPSDTTYLTAESCDPSQVGTTQVLLSNQYGCDSLIITTTSLLPSNTTTLQATTCDPSQSGTTQVLLTNQYGCDSLVVTNTVLLPTDTTLFVFTSCLASDTGLVVTLLSNQYGCDSIILMQTNLAPASQCLLDALVLSDTISCQDPTGSLTLTFQNGQAPYTYIWTSQSGSTGSGTFNQGGQQVVNGLPPGNYTFQVTDVDGLVGTFSGFVFQPNPIQLNLQVTSDFNGFDISCFGATDGAAAVTVQSGGLPPYTYNWSNGSQTAQANGLGEGTYSVTVNDIVNCETMGSVLIDGPDSLQFSLELANPDCFTNGLGAINVTQVVGGTGPYRYSVNGGTWQNQSLFSGLASGQYLIEVEDANGCTASSYAFINSYTPLMVSLGPDESIQYGDSTLLQPIANVAFGLLDSIYWGGVDCADCPSVMVAPVATSSYSVTVVDGLGCTASDDLTVVVKKDFRYYIPNVFSPNDDGLNDVFMIFSGPQVVKVHEFQVFDRWGEPVFTYFNFPPNDLNYGWDGKYRDKIMDTAVFAYYAILEFVDGSTQLVKGDVLLMR